MADDEEKVGGEKQEEKKKKTERNGWSTSKKVGVIIGIAAVLIVTVIAALYFLLPPSMTDYDHDGILDYVDIYRYGNGKIYCNITYYNGDSSPDGLFGATGELDPYFVIMFDVNNDGEFQSSEKYRSATFSETDEIYNPFSKTIDIPDNTKSIRVSVETWDDDGGDPADAIDYEGDSGIYNWIFVEYDTFSGVYSYIDNGVWDDVDDEIDAEIRFEIGITGVEM